MKKGWKILLISCGICAGIGVVLSVAGTVLGGVRDLQEYGRRGMISLCPSPVHALSLSVPKINKH